jgi:MFS family permease
VEQSTVQEENLAVPAITRRSEMKLNAYLVKSTVVAAPGGLLFGFDTAVIAGTTHTLTTVYILSPSLPSMTMASALWGTTLGSLLAGIPGDGFCFVLSCWKDAQEKGRRLSSGPRDRSTTLASAVRVSSYGGSYEC